MALAICLAITTATAGPASAAAFNPNRLLSDQELRDAGNVSVTAIQRFLERNNSVLGTYRETVNGDSLSAAELIHRVAEQTKVSVKFLLAMVEREQGLLRKSVAAAKQSDLDWATGYSCFGGRCNDKYRGFFNQIESTAITQNIYFDRAGSFTFQAGKPTKTKDGFVVTPENQATANLYIYTPYVGHSPELGVTNNIGGNRLFFSLWQRYFTAAKYPDGFILTDGDAFWKIENGRKRKFKTREVFLADGRLADAITVDAKTLAAYPDGPDIAFANHTIVRSAASGQTLLLHDGKQRPVLDEAALAKLSDFRLTLTSFSEVPTVPVELLEPYPVGTPITASLAYPQGKLFQDETGAPWWVQDGIRHPVHPNVAQVNYPARPPEATTIATLNGFLLGSPIAARDGSVVKNSADEPYVITNGERRKITSAELAIRLFGAARLQAAVTLPDDVLSLHTAGIPLDYLDDTIPDPPPTPTPAPPTYAAGDVTVTPSGLAGLTGQTLPIQVSVKNTGSATWQPTDVTLQLNAGPTMNFSEATIAPGQAATFSGNLTLPTTPGLQPQKFTVTGPGGAVLQRFAQFALVQPGIAAEVMSHTLPVAVKTAWRPIAVTVKLKNISTDLTWKSAKAALVLTDADGKPSPFYDAADWVRRDVPAVPTNRKTVAPGQTGEFHFTLKPRGVKPGTYDLRFRLELRDQGKTIPIDGQEVWTRKIRVDK